jgi:hypothetical protein
VHCVCAACDWYLPAVHSVHVLTAETVEYLPTLHSLHELAPPCSPVLVMEPAVHEAHETLPALLA